MNNDSIPSPGLDPAGAPFPPGPVASAAPVSNHRQLIAPVWHTALIVLVMLGQSVVSALVASKAIRGSLAVSEKARILQYVSTIVLEFVFLFLVWVGLRLRRTRIRDVIGGRWETPESVILDVALGVGVCIATYFLLLLLSYLVGLAKPGQLEDTKRLAGLLAPHTVIGLLIFIGLSATAGFVEEVIFRGYLQKQIGALSGNAYVGLFASALVFGAAHGYEGLRRMLLIFILGLIFGFVVLWRKSLRPTMFAHAFFDSAQGVLLFLVTKYGLLDGK